MEEEEEDEGIPVPQVRTVRPDPSLAEDIQDSSLVLDDMEPTLPVSHTLVSVPLEHLEVSQDTQETFDSTAEDDLLLPILMNVKADAHFFGQRDAGRVNGGQGVTALSKGQGCLVVVVRISNGRKPEKWPTYLRRAQAVLESYLQCHETEPRVTKILIRFNRPSTKAIDVGRLANMDFLTDVLESCWRDEQVTIAMTGADSFTANMNSFCRFFAEYSNQFISLAIAKETWKHYEVQRIISVQECLSQGQPPPTTTVDMEAQQLIREWLELALYKDAKSWLNADNPLMVRESLYRNRFDLLGVVATTPIKGHKSTLLVFSPIIVHGRYACRSTHCSSTFPTLEDMIHHLISHSTQCTRGFSSCPFYEHGCAQPFKPQGINSKMLAHLKRHYRLYSVECGTCAWKGYTDTELREHTNSRHSVPRYECPTYKSLHRTRIGLLQHKRQHEISAETRKLYKKVLSLDTTERKID